MFVFMCTEADDQLADADILIILQEAEWERKKTRLACSAKLRDGMHTEQAPPLGIGWCRGSALHNFHALIHVLRTLLWSWQLIFQWCSDVVSVTAGQGAESAIADIPSICHMMFFLGLVRGRTTKRCWHLRKTYWTMIIQITTKMKMS